MKKALSQILRIYESSLKQGTKEWYDDMQNTIGGSEIAILKGLNRYQTYEQLIRKKLGLLKEDFSRKTACHWGKLFEPIIASYINADLRTKVEGSDICIKEIKGHRDSPDGYAIIMAALVDGNFVISDIGMLLLVLLEFKCPLSRRPGRKVPEMYKLQVWSGLAVSPWAQLGLYVDGMFRKCSLCDTYAGNKNYDKTFHADKFRVDKPLAYGIIAVYAPLDSYLYKKLDVSYIDFGKSSEDVFRNVLARISAKTLFVKYYGPYTDFQIRPNIPTDGLVGIIPWKLFQIEYILVERKEGFLDDMIELLEEFETRKQQYSEDLNEYDQYAELVASF